jgi:hypothetical protein
MTAALPLVGSLTVVLIVLAGCGGSGRGRASGPFGWLRAASAPTGWRVARTPGGAALAYPPGWTAIKTDPGTATVALLARGQRIDGYLNATPRQSTETLADWSRFRPEHNHDEGDRDVRSLAATSTARFRSGRGACVIDTYTTSSKASYHEIACLVSGPRASAVVIAAAPTALWDRQASTLERAVSSFTA